MAKDETAKLYASIGIMYCIENFISIYAYRSVYNAGLESFPGAYLLLSASLFLTAGIICSGLMTQKKYFDRKAADEAREVEKGKNDETTEMETLEDEKKA